MTQPTEFKIDMKELEKKANIARADQEVSDWLAKEYEAQQTQTEYNTKPSLKLEDGKVSIVQIDFSNPFNKWTGENNGKPITKAIIPVTHNGEEKNLWLNTKNPIYREILQGGKEGKKEFKILQTGTQQNTKYVILKD